MNENPFIAVIICTYRRFELTGKVIKCFREQTARPEEFELILVDNDAFPNPCLRKMVDEARSDIRISYLFENRIGLSHARNSGGKAASAEYLVYVDDDALVPADYLQNLRKVIIEKQPGIAGGPIYPWYLGSKPLWFKDQYGTEDNSGKSSYLSSTEYLSGTSFCIKRSLLEETGWFSGSLGMRGNRIWLGEETWVQIKAWRLYPGLKVWFDQSVHIQHLMLPGKMNLKTKFVRSFNTGRSLAYLWILPGDLEIKHRRSFLILSKTLFRFMFKGLPGLVLRDRKKYPYWQNYAFEVIARYLASIGQEWQYLKDYLRKSKPGILN